MSCATILRTRSHAGAFGAPTFFVGDEMFWGNDRFDFVEEALRHQA
jgi:2-hydroxychromene-2-carboxylate isomerase